MVSNKKKLLFVLLFLVVVAAGIGYQYYRMIFRTPVFDAGREAREWLYVYPEMSWQEVTDALGQEEAINPKSAKGIALLAKLKPESKPKAGAYELSPEVSAFGLFRTVSGGLQTPVKLTFTSRRLPEEMWGLLARNIMADSASVARAMTDRALLKEIGVNDTTMAYRLIPNTYEVYWTISPKELAKKLEKEYEAFWNETRTAKAKALGLTPYEVSILASIVEEESSKGDEYPRIAGLYLNRIHRGIPLQADPTVKFALRDFGLRRILLTHLQIDSPYNTYKVQGLPPGPIRIPSARAIDGVLNAEQHNYLFMVAKADFSGYHDFSETLAEHSRKARLYQQALNQRGIK